MSCNEQNYYFHKNAFGDVIRIFGPSLLMVAEYVYDAWGNHKIYAPDGQEITDATHIANLNPFRYRGYYYDTDMQLYYLNSRYYSPRSCRFVSADDIDVVTDNYLSTLNGLNLYTYCLNNPIMYTDPSGHLVILIGMIVGAILGFGVAVYNDYIDDGQIFNGSVAWYDYLGAIVIGGAIGAVAGYALPYINSFLNSTYSLGGTVFAGVNIPAITLTGAQVAGGLTALAGIGIVFSRTGKSNGYWGEKYSNDHEPDHFHLKGTNGTDVRIGMDGKPLKGEKGLTTQQRKALKNLWEQIVKLFK